MRDAIHVDGVAPPAVLTWQEEQTGSDFQNGQAAFMRHWPYGYALLQDALPSSVAGVTSMPGAAEHARAPPPRLAARRAFNAHSDQPADAYRPHHVFAAAKSQ